MALTFKAKHQTSDFVLVGNPIILDSEGYNIVDLLHGGRLEVELEGRLIYGGRFQAPLNVDISEIARAATRDYPDVGPHDVGPQPWIEIERVGPGLPGRLLRVRAIYNENDDEIYEMIALPGGLPGSQLRAYIRGAKDVFDSRLRGAKGNFFMTTRTAGWRIEIRETELFPLYFLSTGQLITLKAPNGKYIDIDLPSGLWALSINQARKLFAERFDMLCNVFDVITEDQGFCCQIAVTESPAALERYRLKFRNSLGAFEILEISGKMTVGREVEEGTAYRRKDPVTGEFIQLRERSESRRQLSITTPLPHGYEEFLADMLGSEEVYLLDAYKEETRVIVTSQEMSFNLRPDTPESITLKMEPVEADLYCGEGIRDAAGSRKPRVHSEEFNKPFN